MNKKKTLRMGVDLLMVIVLLLLMAYSLIGETVHEVLGVIMFTLFVIHHFLNISWFKGIAKGRYNITRLMMTVTNLAMLILMLLQIIAGIVLSKHVFASLGLSYGTGTFRLIHLAVPYWLFILMSMHLGFHWKAMLATFTKRVKKNGATEWALRIAVIGISVYGIYAFAKRQFPGYMFLKSQFAFFDFSEPVIRFILDYIAVMILFAAIGYYLMRLISIFQKKGSTAK